MKKIILVLIFLEISAICFSQSVSINATGNPADASAMLDIVSSDRGILIPRMADHTSIGTPATGVLVFNTSTNSFWFYNGTAWTQIAAEGGSGTLDEAYDWGGAGAGRIITADNGAVQIGNGTDVVNLCNTTSSIIDISSTNKGLLIPRLAITGTTTPISGAKTEGLLVYNTSTSGTYSTKGFMYWDGSDWAELGGGGGSSALDENWKYGFTYNSGTSAYDNPEDNTGAIYHKGWVIVGKTSVTYAASNDESKRALLQVGEGIYTDNFFDPNGAIIQIGTTEYIQDGGSNKFAVHGDWCPRETNDHNLGESAHRWYTLYVGSGGVNQSSDRTLKKNIKTIEYGIDAVMKLKPVTYNWKDAPYEHTHIGFIAQDLLEVIPEVVSTYHYERVEENSDKKIKIENETLGVFYSDIIPVLTKAIQEQQKTIEQLNIKLTNYEKRLSELENK